MDALPAQLGLVRQIEEVDAHACRVEANGLSRNGLARNGLSRNGLARNGLARNGLARNGACVGGAAACEGVFAPTVTKVRLASGVVIALR